MLKYRIALLGIASIAILAGCSSPSQPIEDPIVFQGEVGFEGDTFHALTLQNTGTVEIRLTDLQARLIEVTLVERQLAIGLGLGRPNEGGCATSFSTVAVEGSSFSFGLSGSEEFCVRIFDSGQLPEDAVVAYTVTISPAG